MNYICTLTYSLAVFNYHHQPNTVLYVVGLPESIGGCVINMGRKLFGDPLFSGDEAHKHSLHTNES